MMGPGIVGKDFEIMKHLGFISMIRGTDAAGLFETNTRYGGKRGKFDFGDVGGVKKIDGDWSYLMYDIETDKKSNFMCNVGHDLVMGHVRWATRGAYSAANAHPFTPGNIVGMHNGTLVDVKYNLDKDKTDSEAMFEDIARNGLIDVLPKLDPKSAYAITMYDKASKVVYFARNEMRPLHFAMNEERSVMYWASEPWFLTCALGRLGVKYRLFSIKPGVIVAVKPQDIRKGMEKVFRVIYNRENVEKLVEQIAHNANKKEEETPKETVKSVVASRVETKGTYVKIHDITDKDDKKLEDMFVHCSCGKHRLNLFDSYMVKKSGRFSEAISVPLKYSRETGQFECPISGSENNGVSQ